MGLGGTLCGLIIFCSLVVGNVGQERRQQQRQQCMNELRFCIKYLKNTTSQPSDSCCQPLDYVVKTIPECFCSLMGIFGINRVLDLANIAQTLPARCGQHINPIQCITGPPDPRSDNPDPNSVSCKYWSSSLATIITTSAVFLILQPL